jgi:hypothetical protein
MAMTIDGSEEMLDYAERLKTSLVLTMYGGASLNAAAAADADASYLSAIPPWSNIVGFGYGVKWTASSISAMDAVRVYVRTKLPKGSVSDRDRVPDMIEGVPTDVIAVGDIVAAFPRPTPGGVSGGHRQVDNGTLGCLVSRNGGGEFILSNNHVLANINGTGGPHDILEPALNQGGSAHPAIARLTDFRRVALNTPAKNEIDAAIAQLITAGSMMPDIQGIGRVNPLPLSPAKLMSVLKHGAITQLRPGIVDDIAADVRIVYPGVGVANFHKQIAIKGTDEGSFAERGDSGALVVESVTRRPVGLLFAVSPPLAYCNRIDAVLGAFGATIL